MKRIPTNVTADGCAYAIVARYEGRSSYVRGLTDGLGFFPATGVLELIEDEEQYQAGSNA